jgi:catechol 2,3-dioxygenase-like lactoylglutathione lyase family enzyme
LWKTGKTSFEYVDTLLYNIFLMSLKWDYVGVISSDLHRSVQFYRLIGIPLPEPESNHVEVAMENGMRFALDSLEQWEAPAGHRMGIAINAETAEGVNDAYRRVLAAGFQGMTEPYDAFWGQRYAQVKDPDGNPVDLYAWI